MAAEEKHVNIERFRSPFESNTEWRIRKKFLSAHVDKFDEARLVCLSQCYVNSRQMGCLYPPQVMKQLNDLSVDFGEDNYSDITNLPSRIKGMESVKFVRSGDQTGSSGASLHQTCSSNISSHQTGSTGTSSYGPSPPKKVANVYGSYGMGFVKSSSEYKSTDVAIHDDQNVSHTNPFQNKRTKGSGLGFGTSPYCTTGISDMSFKFRTLSNAIKDLKVKFGKSKNSIELLQMGVDKAKMAMDCSFKDIVGAQYTHTFVCSVLIDFVQAGVGKGSNKKSAKHTAFDDALAKLSCTDVHVDQSDSENPVLMSSNQPIESQEYSSEYEYHPEPVSYEPDQGMNLYESNFNSISVGNKRKHNSLNGDVTKFIIFENSSLQILNATSILRQSSDINKALLEFQYHPDSNSANINCQVYIEGQFIAEMFAVGKENAKTLAAMEALEVLRKMCWTIKIKQGADCPIEEMLSRDEVMGDIQREAQTISSDNVGSKLLQKMGWCGGGIGAEGNIGRAEPVAVSMEQVINREGLGLHTADGMKNFRKNITKVVEDYAKSETQDDLKFTSDFTKEERAYIHSVSQRLGLKSTSRGKGDDRYLTLSRKRTANQLFDHVMNEGGSTHKYDLIPPSGTN